MNILVRPLRAPDLPSADRIFRLAFGTFNGLPDPLQHGGDSDKIRTRWLADPGAAFGAEVDGVLVGSNFVTHWGSVGYFGPLTVSKESIGSFFPHPRFPALFRGSISSSHWEMVLAHGRGCLASRAACR